MVSVLAAAYAENSPGDMIGDESENIFFSVARPDGYVFCVDFLSSWSSLYCAHTCSRLVLTSGDILPASVTTLSFDAEEGLLSLSSYSV